MSKPLSAADHKLIDMAFIGNSAGVQEALKMGADIHADDDAAFYKAACNGHTSTAELLLDEGANIHTLNDAAIRDAAMEGHADTVLLLLDRGVDIHVNDDMPLRTAAQYGHTELVEELLKRKASIHAKEDAALREAAAYGYADTVWLLLQWNADIHACDDEAFRRAVFNNRVEAAALLLRYGADPHQDNNKALQMAGENDSAEMIMLLLRHGANPVVVRNPYRTSVNNLLSDMKDNAAGNFLSAPPSRDNCFTTGMDGKPWLRDSVLDACLNGHFGYRIATPLICSGDKADHQLFQDIWEALPAHWKQQNLNAYVQFTKADGAVPSLGMHTEAFRRDAMPDGQTARIA